MKVCSKSKVLPLGNISTYVRICKKSIMVRTGIFLVFFFFITFSFSAQRLMNSSRSTVGYLENGRVMNSSRSTIGYIENGRVMNGSRSTIGYIENGRVMNSSRSTIGYYEGVRGEDSALFFFYFFY